MSKGRLLLINIIGMVVVLALIASGVYFYYEKQNYVKTEDAVVSADISQVVATNSGLLTNWNGKEGKIVSDQEKLGKISNGQQALPVESLATGTIIKNEAKTNQMVQAGQVLAQTADMNSLYITANIEENDLNDIEVGDSVDITVDGDSESLFNGKIEEIGYATNSVFSVLPSQNSSGTYTKVTQKVPVKISIENPSSKVLPGMNAEVKISI
ncbi:HlyD family secretion protein [Bacillus salipaludis]|uniref:HlyD family efflux transporter periplasmic adaptor subunit n=1 Tax=Bacillus salipaludis TaxID=2547811 RepID=A0A4R5W1U4_9BACI|nr:HlyD family efflux transporter periplasmic adaptor subunit [Bacillus salipaludis]MDQ6596656.1 HlyD family efflux transporter periplasmic adaptor subunit [Bacillus salipaludis]TDK65103.1 HlyD family secretion protein [Bacillus salipaludis]